MVRSVCHTHHVFWGWVFEKANDFSFDEHVSIGVVGSHRISGPNAFDWNATNERPRGEAFVRHGQRDLAEKVVFALHDGQTVGAGHADAGARRHKVRAQVFDLHLHA